MFWKQINQSAKFREEIVDKTAKEIEKKKTEKGKENSGEKMHEQESASRNV